MNRRFVAAAGILGCVLLSVSGPVRAAEPARVGAFFGPLSEFLPGARIQIIIPEGLVSSATSAEIKKAGLSVAAFIDQTRRQQIVKLLQQAKAVAAQNNADGYAVANMHPLTTRTGDTISVETWGDMLAIELPRPPAAAPGSR